MLSIIIVNYKNEHKTVSYINEELIKVNCDYIVVVVNNSANNESNSLLCNSLSAELVNDINCIIDIKKKCYVISHPENLGFAKGNNLGAKFSKRHFNIDYFLFTNNDIKFLNNDVVEMLMNKIETLPKSGLIGPKVLGLYNEYQSPEPYWSFWNRYVWMYWLTPFISSSLKVKIFKLNFSQNAKEGVHYKIMGSFFLMKAKSFFDCGMMDTNTFLYAEEVILSERLIAIGQNCYYYPNVAIRHEHAQTTTKYMSSKNKVMTLFESESYYYYTYKGISNLSIFIGRISLLLYLKIK